MRYQANQLRQQPGPGNADILRALEAKIQEHERLEEQRRRKGKKIAEMVRGSCCSAGRSLANDDDDDPGQVQWTHDAV
jgi:hypothetical protein